MRDKFLVYLQANQNHLFWQPSIKDRLADDADIGKVSSVASKMWRQLGERRKVSFIFSVYSTIVCLLLKRMNNAKCVILIITVHSFMNGNLSI